MLAVVFQLFDRLADVSKRRMVGLLDKAPRQIRFPAPAKLLQRAHIEVTIVKPGFQLRHVLRHETAILPDRVAAHRAGRLRNVFRHETQCRRFDCRLVER